MTKDSAETPSTLSKGKGLSLSWSGLSSQSMQAPSGSNFFSKLKNSTPPFASKQCGGDEIPLKHSGSQTQKPSSADDSLVNTWMKDEKPLNFGSFSSTSTGCLQSKSKLVTQAKRFFSFPNTELISSQTTCTKERPTLSSYGETSVRPCSPVNGVTSHKQRTEKVMYLGKECNITSTEDGRLQLRYFDYEDIREEETNSKVTDDSDDDESQYSDAESSHEESQPGSDNIVNKDSPAREEDWDYSIGSAGSVRTPPVKLSSPDRDNEHEAAAEWSATSVNEPMICDVAENKPTISNTADSSACLTISNNLDRGGGTDQSVLTSDFSSTYSDAMTNNENDGETTEYVNALSYAGHTPPYFVTAGYSADPISVGSRSTVHTPNRLFSQKAVKRPLSESEKSCNSCPAKQAKHCSLGVWRDDSCSVQEDKRENEEDTSFSITTGNMSSREKESTSILTSNDLSEERFITAVTSSNTTINTLIGTPSETFADSSVDLLASSSTDSPINNLTKSSGADSFNHTATTSAERVSSADCTATVSTGLSTGQSDDTNVGQSDSSNAGQSDGSNSGQSDGSNAGQSNYHVADQSDGSGGSRSDEPSADISLDIPADTSSLNVPTLSVNSAEGDFFTTRSDTSREISFPSGSGQPKNMTMKVYVNKNGEKVWELCLHF